MSSQPKQKERRWSRSYPPLLLLGVAILAAVLVLPSALNLPQSNPTTVLEYAPVPPDDDEPPPPVEGNVQALGLGTSGTVAKAVPPKLPPPLDEGIGGRPQEKRCVGNPPRQTEDPAAPPCVPFFDGDNFGATYQGVKKDEITVLVYMDSGSYGFAAQSEDAPASGTYVNIDKAPLPPCPKSGSGTSNTATDPNVCDHVLIRMIRGFSRYFNDRFQTYDRHVHYWAYFTNSNSAAERRSDAVANWEKLKPFGVIDSAGFNGFNKEYQAAMTQLGVMTFSSTISGLPNAFYRTIAPLGWGYYPDLEHWEALYSSYVCQKVKPFKVSHYGKPQGQGAPNGQPRKYGIYYTTDPAQPGLQSFAQNLLKDLKQCGITPVESTYDKSGFAVDGTETGAQSAQAAARFRQENVTTIMYVGTETRFSNALDAVKYYPEIIIAGDLTNDGSFVASVQNQNSWANAWAMTYHTRNGRREQSPGYRAYKEGDPAGAQAQGDAAGAFAEDAYPDHFMLFQGIQVAGPKLTPESVDQGFHAIPERASTDPFTAAFFFDPGDYTSTKDAAEQWWDPAGRAEGSNTPGCFRMANNGDRSLAGRWTGKDDVFANTKDPCNGYSGTISLRA